MVEENFTVNESKKYALIIGIENYPESSGQPKVPYAVNDAKEMAKYARKAGFELVKGKPLLDDEATNREVIGQLSFLFKQVNPDDFVLLYYAGHGYFTEYGGYLIPFDYRKEDDINEATCISYDSIGLRFRYNKSKKFIFFLDTCHSGLAVEVVDVRKASRGATRGVTGEIAARINGQIREMIQGDSSQQIIGRVVFSSSGPLEESYSIDEFKHGLFTHYLISGLKSTKGEEYINVEELIPQVRRNVRDYCLRHGKKTLQNPAAFTNIQGEFLVPAYEITRNEPPPQKKIDTFVFISYAGGKSDCNHSDREIAERICSVLETEDIRCWIAPRDIPPGAKWDDAITEAIEKSRIMVLVYSSNTKKSRWVDRELTLAMTKDMLIIPFRIENIEPPSGNMKLLMVSRQRIDAYTEPLENHLDTLKKSVLSYLDEESRNLKTTVIEIIPPPPPDLNPENGWSNKYNIFHRFSMFLYIAINASISFSVIKNYVTKGGFLNILGSILYGILAFICLFLAAGWGFEKAEYKEQDRRIPRILSMEISKISLTFSLSLVAYLNKTLSPDAFFSIFSLLFLIAIALNVRAFSRLTDVN